jgi:hypothetical protein
LPSNVNTVYIELFTTRDFRKGDVEFRLTEALAKRINQDTHLRVVPREQADTILEGEVRLVKIGSLSKERNTGLPREQLLQLEVEVTWKDLRTGEYLVRQRKYSQPADFLPALRETPFSAEQDAIEQMAEAIVEEMEAEW